jgi:long-subunit fatty acid transport protein
VRGSLVFGVSYQQTASFDRTLAFSGQTNQSSISSSFLPFDDEFSVGADDIVTIFYDPAFIAFNGGLIEFLPENIGSGEALFYEAVAPGTTIQQRSEVRERGAMHEISFGGAVEAAPGVMIGGGVNLSTGSYELERRFEEIDFNDENQADDYTVLTGDQAFSGFDRSFYDVGVEANLLGVNARLGVSVQPQNSPLRLGLTAETPTYLSINEDFFTRIETRFDDGNFLSFNTLDDSSIPSEYEYAIITPWCLGLGVSYAQGPAFFGLDIETMDWADLEFDDPNGDAPAFFADLNQQIDQSYGRVYTVRAGGEFTFDRITLRGGLAFEQDPASESSVFDDGGGDGISRERTTASFGGSWNLGNRTFVDLGYSYTQFNDANIPYADAAASPFVTEDIQRSRLLIGVRVGF